VDVGSDFPAETLDVIESWNTACVFREDPSRLTTRAWNGYHPDEKRGKSLVISLEGTHALTRPGRLQILDSEIKTRA
jgi:hypothetical protein